MLTDEKNFLKKKPVPSPHPYKFKVGDVVRIKPIINPNAFTRPLVGLVGIIILEEFNSIIGAYMYKLDIPLQNFWWFGTAFDLIVES